MESLDQVPAEADAETVHDLKDQLPPVGPSIGTPSASARTPR